MASFLKAIRKTVKSQPMAKPENLICQLNPRIRGWANYFRHVCAKKTFYHIDDQIFRLVRQWIKWRHPQKSSQWRKKKYFRSQGNRNWIFSTEIQSKDGKKTCLDLFKAGSVTIRRHIKIRAEATTPFDHNYREYFQLRERKNKERLARVGKKAAVSLILDNQI